MESKSFKKIISIGVLLVGGFVVATMSLIKLQAAPSTTSNTQQEVDYEQFFEKDKIIDIHVEIDEKDWESILADPLAEEYKSATVTVDGVKVENVGFRTKGNLTLKSVANTDSDRYSFRIKLDKYVKGQSLLGLDEFVVNNMYSDPSYMREYLSYEALREIGADVPLTSFANIYINGELYGFYLCVEAIDDSFIERNFDNADGSLYKQEQGSSLEYQEGSEYEKSELKSGKDKTKTDLKTFIQTLNEMPEGQKGNIEEVLDVDSALKYIAVNTVLANYDSYNGNMSHNYYLYSEDGKFTVIPWDYNMSIGGFGGAMSQTSIPIDEPVLGLDINKLPLIKNLLAVEEYKNKYHDYIEELLEYLEGFESRVETLANIIRPYVEADPTKFVTMEQFEANITAGTLMTQNSPNTQTPPNTMNEGEMPTRTRGERPDMPQGMPQGTPPEMPDGEHKRLEGVAGDMPQGEGVRAKGGMGMGGQSVSIVTLIKERVENIKAQLAGELPTTGNTTMTQTKGR